MFGMMVAAGLAGSALAEDLPAPLVRPPASVPRERATDVKASAKNPNEVVCKAGQVTGTRLPAGHVCRAQQEWDELERQTRIVFERSQDTLLQLPIG